LREFKLEKFKSSRNVYANLFNYLLAQIKKHLAKGRFTRLI